MKILLKALILTAACLLIVKSYGLYFGMKNPLIGGEAPDFTLSTLSGREISMAGLRDGKPAILFFWATWCPHCRTQLKGLMQSQAELKKDNIKVILVDIGESARKIQHYMNTNKIPFDTYLDDKEEVARKYKIVGVPTFFFINTEGTLVAAENILPANFKNILLGGRVP